MLKLMERELAEMQVGNDPDRSALKEAAQQFLGTPWQSELSSLTLDKAWQQGFPDLSLALQYDAAYVARSDTQRNEMLKVCRILYDSHPHAKAIVETMVGFVCGPHAWHIEPSPKFAYSWESTIHPVGELREDNDPSTVDPVSKDILPVGQGFGGRDPLSHVYDDDEDFKDERRIDRALQRKIERLLQKYMRRGQMHPSLGWVQFWTEAYRRTRRDGEVFIYKGNVPQDGRLSPRFLEPEDIVHPTGAQYAQGIFDPNQNGIQVDVQDPHTVLGYWYRRGDRLGALKPEFITADKIIHVKHGVDSGVKRGLPTLFVCRHFLRHFDSWIQQSLKHQKIQTMVALLRQWDKATPDAVQNFLTQKEYRSNNVSAPSGQNFHYATSQILPVVDAPRGMSLQPFVPSGNYGDSEILARRVLLACAAGENLSEAMVTADGSNANYASTRITQIIPFRGFEAEQGLWSETVLQYYESWVKVEAAFGRLPRIHDDCQLDANVTPTKLPNFEGEITSQMVTTLRGAGIISLRTAMEMVGIDPEVEEERMAEEERELTKKQELARQTMMGEPGQPEPGQPETEDSGAAQAAGDAPAPGEVEPLGTDDGQKPSESKNGNSSKNRIHELIWQKGNGQHV
jgi:capsid protein